MEANLNQFRLLTVRGEQDANARQGSCSGGRSRQPHDGTRGVSEDSESSGGRSVNGSASVLPTLGEHDTDCRRTGQIVLQDLCVRFRFQKNKVLETYTVYSRTLRKNYFAGCLIPLCRFSTFNDTKLICIVQFCHPT